MQRASIKPYTFRDWLKVHKGRRFLRVSFGYWRELLPWSWQHRHNPKPGDSPWWTYLPYPGHLFRWDGWLPEMWYYIKCRLWHRYNTVTARTLPPTWQDADTRMLHINFEILRSVIEDERIFEHTAPEGDPNDGSSWAWALKEMAELWEWWTVTRPAQEAEQERRVMVWSELLQRDRDNYTKTYPDWQTTEHPNVALIFPPDEATSDETRAAWAALHEIDDDVEDAKMLTRLIKLRGYLWT